MGLEKWKDLVGEDELKAYDKAGFGRRIGFGKHPAILNVDMTYMFVDTTYASTSGDMGPMLKAVMKLTQVAREACIPLFYSRRDDRNHAFRRGIWNQKLGISTSLEYTVDKRADEWPPEIAPSPEDVIIYKNKPSPFFGTPLASFLTYAEVDTLIVVGISTSGCVRAAVEDSFSYNYRTIVPEECVGDRCHFAHRANLFDMDMKFADVVRMDEVVEYLKTLKKLPLQASVW
jgi:maleamate amidohydrolase